MILDALDARSPDDALILRVSSGVVTLHVSEGSNTFVKIVDDGTNVYTPWEVHHTRYDFTVGHERILKIRGGLPPANVDEKFTGFDLRPREYQIVQQGIVPMRSDLYTEKDIQRLRKDVKEGKTSEHPNAVAQRSPLHFVRMCLKHLSILNRVPQVTISDLPDIRDALEGVYAFIISDETGRIATVLTKEASWPPDIVDDNRSELAVRVRLMLNGQCIIPALRNGTDEGVTAVLVAARALNLLQVAVGIIRIAEAASDDQNSRRFRADSEVFDLETKRAENLDRISKAAALAPAGPFPGVLVTNDDHDMMTREFVRFTM